MNLPVPVSPAVYQSSVRSTSHTCLPIRRRSNGITRRQPPLRTTLSCRKASRDSFQRNGVAAGRLTVVRNGIYPLEKREEHDDRSCTDLDQKKVLLNVARFSKQKDHATLLQAMVKVADVVPSALLLLVGEGEEMDAIRELVETS